MAALMAWAARLLPLLFAWGLRAYFAINTMRFGWRLILIGVIGSLIPLPSWVTELPGKLASLPATFLYFSTLVQLGFGLMVVFSAYTTRWIWNQMTKSV